MRHRSPALAPRGSSPGVCARPPDRLTCTAHRQRLVVNATNDEELETAFAAATGQHAAGMVVTDDPLFATRQNDVVALAARHAIPTIMGSGSTSVPSGGLMSYGASAPDIFREMAVFVAKILGGANPAELPAEQPMRVTLSINLKTAKTLGIAVPESTLIRADEVID